ncbi:hypothetical protein [Nostoc sp. MG11]|uniref:hypothetical protein n=1 Tax=Nostoc sp. MG11 TaxID=2721166 RepID=UPI0018672586|nr:hypothetical protein [Nostoc sp. MG11]
MAKILVFDFHFSDVEIFLHELAPAQAETVLGGYFSAKIMTIHDGINRVETQTFGSYSTHDNNYNSIDNSDQVYIWAYPYW